MPEDDKGRIDELSEKLYSKTRYNEPSDKRRVLGEEENPEVRDDWESPKLDELLMHERKKVEGHPIMKKLFISAIVFFVLAIGIAAYIYFSGGNFISSKNVEISVLGPVSVSAGKSVELNIAVSNRNNADLEMVNMTIDYPEGVRSADDSTEPLTRSKTSIGSINSGKDFVQTERMIFFGQRGEIQSVNILVEYRVKGSNATFNKQKTFETVIGVSPVEINIQKPPSIVSGAPFTIVLTLQVNSTDPIRGVLVRGEYPYGFSPLSVDPISTTEERNFWVLGDLAPGEKKTISIRGVLVGEDRVERTFRFYAGVSEASKSDKFSATLAVSSETVSLSRPAVGLSLNINGDESNPYIAPAGAPITMNINYQNNLPENLINAQVRAVLSGASLDKFSVRALNGGFYNSADNSIVWDRTSNPSLSLLEPGDRGTLSFSFAALSGLPTNLKSPEIGLQVSVTGTESGENASNRLTTSDSRTVRIASQISLSSRAIYSRGPFKNTGPVPPKAEKETTYTIVLDLRNTQNDIERAKVTATLGPNVKWVTPSAPAEDVVYDPLENTVTWDVNKLLAGTGFSAPLREAYIQVVLTPSIGQIGSTPALLNNVVFSGRDSFTDQTVSVTNPLVTTLISSDPKFIQGDGIVVK